MMESRRGAKYVAWGLGLVGTALALCGCAFFLVCGGLIALVELPITLAFGWVRYVQRVVPQLNPDPWSVASALACLAGVTVGTHLFLRWVYSATGPRPEGAPAPRWPWKRSLQLVGLLMVMFVAGTAATGFVQQTGWLFRSKEPLAQLNAPDEYGSRYNMVQFGRAFAGDNPNGKPVPQSRFDATGRQMHSWQTYLLPYLGDNEKQISARIDYTKPWTDPKNAAPLGESVYQFQNTAFKEDKVNGYGASHYAGNAAVVLGDPKTIGSFPAGASNTIFCGEVSSNFRAWGDPLNARDPRLGSKGHPDGFGGARGKPAQFLMLDGSVRTFDPAALAALTPEAK